MGCVWGCLGIWWSWCIIWCTIICKNPGYSEKERSNARSDCDDLETRSQIFVFMKLHSLIVSYVPKVTKGVRDGNKMWIQSCHSSVPICSPTQGFLTWGTRTLRGSLVVLYSTFFPQHCVRRSRCILWGKGFIASIIFSKGPWSKSFLSFSLRNLFFFWLKKTQIYSLTVVEARNPKSRC